MTPTLASPPSSATLLTLHSEPNVRDTSLNLDRDVLTLTLTPRQESAEKRSVRATKRRKVFVVLASLGLRHVEGKGYLTRSGQSEGDEEGVRRENKGPAER